MCLPDASASAAEPGGEPAAVAPLLRAASEERYRALMARADRAAAAGNAVRAAICRACAWVGLELDEAANRQHSTRISRSKSRVAAYVIKTDENLMIARHARALVGG